MYTHLFDLQFHQFVTMRKIAKRDTILRQALISPRSLIMSVRRADAFTWKRRRIVPHRSKPITLHTNYHPPFNWSALLQFLHSRTTPQEWVTENAYHRLINGHEIIVANVHVKNCLSIKIPPGISYQANTFLGKTRTLFDLDANPHIIEAVLSRDLFLHQLIVRHPGLRVPGCWDNFELLLRVVIGQQISVSRQQPCDTCNINGVYIHYDKKSKLSFKPTVIGHTINTCVTTIVPR